MNSTVLALTCITAAAAGIVGLTNPRFFREKIDFPAQLEQIYPSFRTISDLKPGERVGTVLPDDRRSSPLTDRSAFTEIAQVGEPATTTAQPPTPQVDESALRYFASKGDKARLDAEIARLRTLYPNWIPPRDPLAIPHNEDAQLERMWQLYSESRYGDVRQAIADRQAADPAWTPPADLIERLTIAEARARLVAASDARDYAQVVDVGAAAPSLLTCSDVDVLWRVAEAFALTERPQRARDAYSYILRNCEDTAERIATIQKAAALLGYQDVQELMGFEKTTPEGAMEFEVIRDDLARRFVADGDEDTTLEVDASYLHRIERLAERDGLAADALLLGWYQFRRGNTAPAERWFRKAYETEETASAAQGLALTLIDRDDPRDAEDILYRWRDSSDDAKATYLAATANLLAADPPPRLEPDVLRRIAAVTTETRDVATAQQFGWYALALRQPATGAQWFETALGWKDDDEPSAYGLAVARLQLEDTAGLRAVQRLWQGRSDRIARVGEQAGEPRRLPQANGIVAADTPRATDTEPSRRSQGDEPTVIVYDGASSNRPARAQATTPKGCRTTVDPRSLSASAALSRGWCLMELNRPLEAARAFEVVLGSGGAAARQDAAYGQSLAYLRAGLINEAAVAATQSKQSPERMAELQASILTDRATSAFNAGRYRETILFLDQLAQIRSERTDLMVLRGYAYQRLNRPLDARRIFEALAGMGNRDAIRALADLRAS